MVPAGANEGVDDVELSSPSLAAPRRRAERVNRSAFTNRLLTIAVAVSMGAHVAAFVAWMFWPSSSHAAVDLDEAVIKTRLVKLGKPRDEKLLPRLPTAPPPKPVDKKAPPEPDPTPQKPPDTKPTPKEDSKPSAMDILDRFKSDETKSKDINDLIKDRIGEPTDEGREDGDRDGSALDGEIVASYFARVQARIQNAMEVSSVLTDEERVRLKSVLCVSIDEVGTVTRAWIKNGSGSQIYDSDVVAGARRASPVPAPPPPARQQAKEICFNACPVSCK